MQSAMYGLYDITGLFDFGTAFIIIVMLPIMYKSEDVVKTIFGLEANNLQSGAVMAGMLLAQANKFAKTSSKVVKTAANKYAAAAAVNKPGATPGGQQPPQQSQQAIQNQQAVQNQQPAATGTRLRDRAKQGAKNVFTGKGLAKELALKAMGMAMGYGATGDYTGALTGKNMQEGVRNTAKKTWYDVNRKALEKKRENEALDAYERLKEENNYTDEQMYHLSQQLLNTEIDDAMSESEKNLAGWLQSVRDTQIAINSQDSKKEEAEIQEDANQYVLELLQKHILK